MAAWKEEESDLVGLLLLMMVFCVWWSEACVCCIWCGDEMDSSVHALAAASAQASVSV
jgi:hypothetical protein